MLWNDARASSGGDEPSGDRVEWPVDSRLARTDRVTLTRVVTFSAGHRYWSTHLSEAENRARFGAWASPFNHGHNYQLEVSAEGPVAADTGMVVNIKTIDDVLGERVRGRFDQRSINDEVPEFRDRPSSVENLLLYFRETLTELPGGARLTGLRLVETPTLAGAWSAAEPTTVTLTRTYEFAASHRLNSPHLSPEANVAAYGKCNHVHGHGHNYVLEVTVGGLPDPETGMLVDLGELDAVVEREIMDRYDHRNLDVDVPELAGRVTTSEVVAQAIFDRLVDTVPARLERVTLYETARNRFDVVRVG